MAAVICATPRSACSASITARIAPAPSGPPVDRVLQFHDASGHVIHFLEVIGKRRLQRRLIEVDRALHPLQVLLRPGFHPVGGRRP